MITGRAGEKPWARFPKTASYRMDLMGRSASVALAAVLSSIPLFAWPFLVGSPDQAEWGAMLVTTVACLACAALALRWAANARFEMGPQAMTVYGLGGGRTVQYAAITGLTASRQTKSVCYSVWLETSGDGSLRLYPDDHHLRDDDLLAWLSSIPRQGGVEIQRPRDTGTTWVERGVIALLILTAGFMLASVVREPIDLARAVIRGYPPLSTLSRREGTAVMIGTCQRPRRGPNYLPVTLRTDIGDVNESVGCNAASALHEGSSPHDLVVYRDRRRFADGGRRQVEVDGRIVEGYADYIARGTRFDRFALAGQLMLMLGLCAFGYGAVESGRRAG
jgi:hypothetical protein